jgi:hypothetical protein
VTREELKAELKQATAKVETLESLAEIERVSRRAAGLDSEEDARDIEAKLEKAKVEQEAAQHQLDLLDNGTLNDN